MGCGAAECVHREEEEEEVIMSFFVMIDGGPSIVYRLDGGGDVTCWVG